MSKMHFDVHKMRRVFAFGVIAALSGGSAFVTAALLGTVLAFATAVFALWPEPTPSDSTDYGRGLLMVIVGICVFVAVLMPLWIVCFKYLWKRCDADFFIANGIARRVRIDKDA